MELGALDGALDSWRRERESRAWERYRALTEQERQLRHQAAEERLRFGRRLGRLGEHASEASALEAQADRCKRLAKWWRTRLTVRRYEERRSECGTWSYEGTCQHCGLFHSWPRRCGAHVVCADCARARSKRLTRKLVPSIRLAHARAMAKWHGRGRPKDQMPLIALVTLTMRGVDIADLDKRRKLLSEAWNRFRTWWQVTYRSTLPYAWTVECTEGKKGQGHVHAHVVTMLPKVHYPTLQAAWNRAVGGDDEHKLGHIDFSRRRSTPKRAAMYIAKYASKGVKFASVHTASAWVRAQHGKRGVSTSRGWWWVEPTHGPWLLTLRRSDETVVSDQTPEARRGPAPASASDAPRPP